MSTTEQPTPTPTTPPEVAVETPQQAVSLLIQGVQVAQQRGAYQLTEASLLSDAVSFLTGAPNPTALAPEGSEVTEESEETDETVEETDEN